MKRTFWTRNVWIGVLMGLVLAFGMQGTADALTFGNHSSSDGDLQTVFQNDNIIIRVPVTLQSPTKKSTHTNYKQTPTADVDASIVAAKKNKNTYYLDDYDPDNDTTAIGYQSETQVTYDAAHDYDQEQITITVTGNAAIRKVGSHDVPAGAPSPLPMYEQTHDSYDTVPNYQRLSGNLTLTLAPTGVGTVLITVTDNTATGDIRGGVVSPPIAYTVYIVNYKSTPATDLSFATATIAANSNWSVGRDDDHDSPVQVTVTPAADTPVKFEVVNGPGRFYVQKTNAGGAPTSKSSSSRTLETSSNAATGSDTGSNVYLDMGGGTNRVEISAPALAPVTTIFVYGYPSMEIISGDDQTGVPNARLIEPLGIRVKDGRERAVPGLAVSFDPSSTETLQPVIGSDVYLTPPTASPPNAWATTFTNTLRTREATATIPGPIDEDAAALVPTDRSGEAKVYLEVGAADTNGAPSRKTVTVSTGTVTKTFIVFSAATTDIPALAILSGNNQRSESNGKVQDPLVVRVLTSNNQPFPEQTVTFTTTKGYLTTLSAHQSANDPTTINGPTTQVTAVTDLQGKAAVSYDLVNHEGAADVIAEISSTTVPTYQRRVTFNINGGGTRTPTTPTTPTTPAGSLTISVSGDGATRSVTVTSVLAGASTTIPVVLTGTALGGSTEFVTTGTATEITVPTEPGSYALTATASVAGYAPTTETITVAGPTSLGAISITSIGSPNNGVQTFSISVRDTDDAFISGALAVTVSGTGFTTRSVPTANGSGAVSITLPTTAGSYTLTASAEDYTSGTTTVRIAGTAQTPTPTTTTPTPTVEETPSDPASVSIAGPSQRSGTANAELGAPLLVRVLDADGDAVEDARVIFRVRKGQGRLSQRGNGRAIAVQTDEDGYGRAAYTPMSASSTVEAEVRGVTRTVTFTITTDGSVPSTDTPDTGRDTPGTDEDTTTISPTVLIPPAQRPPMVWVDGGAIYSLIGTEVQEFIPNLNNVMNITIGGGKVYWTAKTSASAGTINAANLDGSGKTELTSIRAIPIGIAVDTPNSKLYWTNSRGRIQSANLDGSGIQNVMQNIRNPNDLALAGGNVYWTESNHGSVRFVNLKGQKQVRVISTGNDPAGSLAIAGGKVYWTEKVGENGGTINSANLNGSGATELASILATPIGIAVDTARSKLYWTNARGRIQSASLSGSSIRNVVSGLGSPGEIVLSNSIKAPTATPPKSTTTAAGKNKYDINGDGAVDDKDVDMLLLAVLSELTAAKYDVNGDGSVDVKDVREVNKNLDTGAASAPALLGRKFSAVQRDRLQDQIDLLVATNDRSPATLKTLIYLQQLLAMARPEKTQLLANYPNPFNPETWIPYELATDTDVRITIYNAQGVVIRTLQLGQQAAGYYTDRERAAYWDGRNALGEQVASGVYFYQLETDDMSSLRKMVILK